MSGYQGMRWFKCDLQVQTPEDGQRWDREDRSMRLPDPRSESDLQEKARRYLQKCHEVELDVIGVTDHNFCGNREPRLRFLTHLIEQNLAVAEALKRTALTIFPGFEVDIGFHVLCLFPPVRKASGLDGICNILSALGLTPDRRFGQSGPVPLRRDGAYVSLAEVLRVVQKEPGGIVIAAHAFERDGIADENGRWAGDYQNQDLLCVEVSRFPLGQREQSVLEATSGVWARQRQPAYIQSSDAKSTLPGADGQPKANSLGYRWTWVKMSEPSIEGFRQAFLDPGSRIRQMREPDPRVVRHDRIETLAVKSVKFLEDQEIAFSPGLNCLIGGRGSGKSSLFEAIRFALRREDDPAAEEQVERIRKTLTPDSVLTLWWREQDNSAGAQGPGDVFEYRPSLARAQVVSRDATDPSTIFQGLEAQIFSQREITAVAKRQDFLLQFIDGLVGPRLRDLEQEDLGLREEIRRLQQDQQTLERLRNEHRSLRQELQEVDRRWDARSAVLEEQMRYRAAREAQGFLDQVSKESIRTVESLERWSADLVESHSPLGSVVRLWPASEFFESLDAEIEKAKQLLAGRIHEAAAAYKERIDLLTLKSDEWSAVQGAIEAAEHDFRDACSRQGLQPEDLEQLSQLDAQRRSIGFALSARQTQISELERRVEYLPEAWLKLHGLWRAQTEVRRKEIDRILQSRAVPRRERDLPVLEAKIESQGDRLIFLGLWKDLAPKGSTRLGKRWEELGDAAFDAFFAAPEIGSPWELVLQWLEGKSQFQVPVELLDLLRDYLLGPQRESWEARRLMRVQDAVDLVLYRNDGTFAGSLRQNQLSEGQTNTAILMLLLASGRGPILIDQPEDELDSNFISSELVPLLRAIKNERQVIVVTHNPNLPVNADAELVYALRAENKDGSARGAVRAQGGLDREEVKDAVLDIMEGSEEAFRKRREKYHF